MRKVTPRMTALRERYGDDKAKLNQEMMSLYKTEKINPLGGSPIVIQIPVFIALYWALLGAVEMRDAPWIGWITDLSSQDPYYVLPIIMMATMLIQTKLNPTPPDPIQAKITMIMPFVFGGMFFFFPSGLRSLLGGQQYLVHCPAMANHPHGRTWRKSRQRRQGLIRPTSRDHRGDQVLQWC